MITPVGVLLVFYSATYGHKISNYITVEIQ